MSSVKGVSNNDLNYVYEVSKGPGDWVLTEPSISGTYPVSPDIRIQGTGASLNCDLVDTDSELMNITRKYSRCPESKYMPGRIGAKVTSTGVQNDKSKQRVEQPAQDGYCGAPLEYSFPDCSLTTENTRLMTPYCSTNEQGYNRWDYLHFNPQENVSIPFDHNINNNNLMRDNHRPCIPQPLDQTACWPKPVEQ